jgi:hypothetical protein
MEPDSGWGITYLGLISIELLPHPSRIACQLEKVERSNGGGLENRITVYRAVRNIR